MIFLNHLSIYIFSLSYIWKTVTDREGILSQCACFCVSVCAFAYTVNEYLPSVGKQTYDIDNGEE